MDRCFQSNSFHQDPFRAQLYFPLIEEERHRLLALFLYSRAFRDVSSSLIDNFCSVLGQELDKLILPVIASEIHYAREKNELFGHSSHEKYMSYFVTASAYTSRFKSLLTRYPQLENMIKSIIKQTFSSLVSALENYEKDYEEIQKQFDIPENIELKSIKLLQGADRHCGSIALLFCYANNKKVVYKPSDLRIAHLFYEFCDHLNLERPYNLKPVRVLPMEGYGWVEFIERKECESLIEVQDFYRRAGSLLAIADCLNFTDGHCENLIAQADIPYLIDFETFFQNYEPSVLRSKNLLTTLLIQKINDEKDPFINSAFQAPPENTLHHFHTHAIHDQTEDLEIRYNFTDDSVQTHCPSFNKKYCPSYDYKSFIIEGFCHTFQVISEQIELLLNKIMWWSKLESIKSRIILRGTVSYSYLLRKIQHPEFLFSKADAENYLFSKLGNTPYTSYEMDQLFSLNIPYFYHFPGKKNLYDSNQREYTDVFTETGIKQLQNELLNRSKEKMEFNCEIIKRHLVPLG